MRHEIMEEYIALIPNVFRSFSELNEKADELSHLQKHVIEFIYMQKRAINIKDISAGLQIAKQQLTGLVKELEKKGYLTKVTDPKDKRAIQVTLTPAGREVEESKWKAIYQKLEKKLEKLNAEEQMDLRYALHKVNVLLTKVEE
ncbi:MarR family transcriptional regulator [Pullulanibacillus sp. KACC 23026]|uniref:MarR family winged helix-turn-helix transcriptional regulator n=1 Tax=Pullulanibacillus sp. KACC 23026 TaxID=3028315 RepID=UPI0023B11D63|nr:MarR family transcriptional regulator [Pullulanibacillus sp. KACC 23026]WEG14701.1 MarR family transcriptional regulator [Pullulanibacillus sp. KACC 23026]